jgi:hypothetical protein
MLAAAESQLHVVRFLLDQGVDVHAQVALF